MQIVAPRFSKILLKNLPEKAISSEKFIFFWEWPISAFPDASPADPTPGPNQALWSRLGVLPRILARFALLCVGK